MKPTEIKILAGMTALVFANWASDLCAQSYDYSPSYSSAPSGSYYTPFGNDKSYLGVDVGVALQQDVTLSDSIGDSEKVSFDPGVRFDMMVGYHFTANWATEFEMGIIANPVSHSYVLGTDYDSITYLQMPVLVNGIYTLPLNKSKSCSVYFGAGAGGVFSKYMDEFGEETPDHCAFAFQGMAGIKWAVTQRLDVGVAYKFLGTAGHDVGPGWDSNGNPTQFKSDGTMNHSILATLTCRF